jgi:hypothetical protein
MRIVRMKKRGDWRRVGARIAGKKRMLLGGVTHKS